MTDTTHQITELLKAWSNGDTEALDRVWPLIDPELKKIARNYMRDEKAGHILQPTALVNEALIKLLPENISWENRKQFYGFVAKRMRQVLIDYVRRTQPAEHIDIDEAVIPVEKSKDLVMLDRALNKLADVAERAVTVVECRYFIGLTLAETAQLLGVGQSTVERDWEFARSFLKREMTGESITESSDNDS
jgi:RNA polymerase sigma factor (TIGR02999 family)